MPEQNKPNNEQTAAQEPKKVSLQEAIKNKLAQDKMKQAAQKNNQPHHAKNMNMKHQTSGKMNKQFTRRSGGS